MILTTDKIKTRIITSKKIYEDGQELISYLAARWMDEKEYENIKDYGKLISKFLKKYNAKLISMIRSPFGFEFEVDGAKYLIKITNKSYSYRRIE